MVMSTLLKHAILTRARVEGEIVLVDGFLNHRVEPKLVDEVGRFLAGALGPCQAIVTSEASGIAPAYAAASALGVDMVFAKKRPQPPTGSLSRRIVSPTKGDTTWLALAPRAIAGLERVAIVDDFLWGGRTALALVEMLREAGIEVTAAGFCVEKTFGNGRSLLEAAGIEVVSAAVITGIEGGRPVVA